MPGKARAAREPWMSMSELSRRLELSLAGVSQSVKRGENDADFQGFLEIIDSYGIACQSPENHLYTPHNIKCLFKVDIQAG